MSGYKNPQPIYKNNREVNSGVRIDGSTEGIIMPLEFLNDDSQIRENKWLWILSYSLFPSCLFRCDVL
jgi:hypothetical protein